MYGWIDSRPMRRLKSAVEDLGPSLLLLGLMVVGVIWCMSGINTAFAAIPDATPLGQIPWGKAKGIVYLWTLAAVLNLFRK